VEGRSTREWGGGTEGGNEEAEVDVDDGPGYPPTCVDGDTGDRGFIVGEAVGYPPAIRGE